jgi:hypothetical protein
MDKTNNGWLVVILTKRCVTKCSITRNNKRSKQRAWSTSDNTGSNNQLCWLTRRLKEIGAQVCGWNHGDCRLGPTSMCADCETSGGEYFIDAVE